MLNVSIVKVKLYQDTEGGVSERSPVFQMGCLSPAKRYEHFRSIKALPSSRWDRSVVMSRENVIYIKMQHRFCWTITKQRTEIKFWWVFGRVPECTKYCLWNVTNKGILIACVRARACLCESV